MIIDSVMQGALLFPLHSTPLRVPKELLNKKIHIIFGELKLLLDIRRTHGRIREPQIFVGIVEVFGFAKLKIRFALSMALADIKIGTTDASH